MLAGILQATGNLASSTHGIIYRTSVRLVIHLNLIRNSITCTKQHSRDRTTPTTVDGMEATYFRPDLAYSSVTTQDCNHVAFLLQGKEGLVDHWVGDTMVISVIGTEV